MAGSLVGFQTAKTLYCEQQNNREVGYTISKAVRHSIDWPSVILQLYRRVQFTGTDREDNGSYWERLSCVFLKNVFLHSVFLICADRDQGLVHTVNCSSNSLNRKSQFIYYYSRIFAAIAPSSSTSYQFCTQSAGVHSSVWLNHSKERSCVQDCTTSVDKVFVWRIKIIQMTTLVVIL